MSGGQDLLVEEKLAWYSEFARSVLEFLDQNLERDQNCNFLGGDIDPDLLEESNRAAAGIHSGMDAGSSAQLQELAFWRYVAFAGYAGEDPRVFPMRQKQFMVETFWKTGWTLGSLEGETLLEVGCGPLGMCEFLPVKSGVAIDPLNEQYSLLFEKVRSKALRHKVSLEGIADGEFDFVICHNVIDHASNPDVLFNSAFRKLKRGGRFLFQVNLCDDNVPRTDAHKAMHPSPFDFDQIKDWISCKSQDFEFQKETEPSVDGEYYFLAWGTKSSDAEVKYIRNL